MSLSSGQWGVDESDACSLPDEAINPCVIFLFEGQQTYPVEIVNIFGFLDYAISVTTTQLCQGNTEEIIVSR